MKKSRTVGFERMSAVEERDRACQSSGYCSEKNCTGEGRRSNGRTVRAEEGGARRLSWWL